MAIFQILIRDWDLSSNAKEREWQGMRMWNPLNVLPFEKIFNFLFKLPRPLVFVSLDFLI